MYGDHIIVSPFKRWCILVAYWSVLASFVIPRGYLSNLLDQEWLPLSPLHVASLIFNVAIFLSLWTFAAYSFNRPWSLFSTLVYPTGQILDTLTWLAVFDLGKQWLLPASSSASMLVQYFAGHVIYSVYVVTHRKTFELWYLPEHHPPRHIRGGLYYVAAAIASGFFFSAVYHWHGDIRWVVLVKYVIDLYVCIRIRLPAPWTPYMHEDNKDLGWDWAGF